MKVLEVEGLVKKYEKFQLKQVSFGVEKGTIMGFIGRNGAGKTTTLKSLLNLVHPDAGTIRFFGKEFAQSELEIKQKIGFVSGGVNYYPKKKLKVITGVSRRFYENWEEDACRKYMELFKLDENKTPDQLSEGMKVKYALMLALSHQAEFLILDEPTSGLDPVSRDELLDVFMELTERDGKTVLFSTHITSDLEKCADSITYIKNGGILAEKSLEQFQKDYKIAHFEQEPSSESVRRRLIGLKKEKHGFSALIPERFQQEAAGAELLNADLESIMVHMEREEKDEIVL